MFSLQKLASGQAAGGFGLKTLTSGSSDMDLRPGSACLFIRGSRVLDSLSRPGVIG